MMRLDDCFHDRKAEAGALDRLIRRVRSAEESVEEPSLVLLGHAHAVVGDFDHADVCMSRGPHADVSTGRSELQGVRDEVVEDLSEPGSIARHLAEAVEVDVDFDVFLRRRRPCGVDRLEHELLELNVPGVERDLAGLHLRDEQEVSNQSQQSIGVALDDRDEFPCSAVSSPASPSRRSSRYPRIEVRGVRSSCETDATKSSFIWSSSCRRSLRDPMFLTSRAA